MINSVVSGYNSSAEYLPRGFNETFSIVKHKHIFSANDFWCNVTLMQTRIYTICIEHSVAGFSVVKFVTNELGVKHQREQCFSPNNLLRY